MGTHLSLVSCQLDGMELQKIKHNAGLVCGQQYNKHIHDSRKK